MYLTESFKFEEHSLLTTKTKFIGRNFNAGEVIQLVLKSRSGAWLPFRHVQMVMMHELAHCKQMNHSKAFWSVRDAYAGELRGLWDRNYSGEGFWGRGQTVLSGEYTNNTMPSAADLPEHTCGGTFRRSGRKRKRKSKEDTPKITYAERQQRRILKKFGKNGTTLGDDESMRVKLEEGKKKAKGKPRVAGSARGRDLRAAAALARFETAKKEEVKEEEDSDTESEYDDWPLTDDEAVANQDGNRVKDGKGHEMVRVCEVEDEEDDNVKREIQELHDVESYIPRGLPTTKNIHSSYQIKEEDGSPTASEDEDLPALTFVKPARKERKQASKKKIAQLLPDDDNGSPTASEDDDDLPELTFTGRPSKRIEATVSGLTSKTASDGKPGTKDRTKATVGLPKPKPIATKDAAKYKKQSAVSKSKKKDEPQPAETQGTCACCSCINEPTALVCIVCSNVLNTRAMPNHWRCQSLACRGGEYINMGDYGICQVCGAKKPAT
jgi:hypothetical protein